MNPEESPKRIIKSSKNKGEEAQEKSSVRVEASKDDKIGEKQSNSEQILTTATEVVYLLTIY